jgi:hypothetical protein
MQNLKEKTNTQNLDISANLKKTYPDGNFSIEKANNLGGKRGCIAVALHIFTFFPVGTNSCLTVDLL